MVLEKVLKVDRNNTKILLESFAIGSKKGWNLEVVEVLLAYFFRFKKR